MATDAVAAEEAALDRYFEELWESKAYLFPLNPKTAAHALYLEGATQGALAARRLDAEFEELETADATEN